MVLREMTNNIIVLLQFFFRVGSYRPYFRNSLLSFPIFIERIHFTRINNTFKSKSNIFRTIYPEPRSILYNNSTRYILRGIKFGTFYYGVFIRDTI